MEIRKAILKDLEYIQQLNNKLFDLEIKCFDPSLKKDWAILEEGKAYFTDMIENNIVFVAITQNQIVGYLAGTLNTQNGTGTITVAELDNMYIDENCRNSGIGSKLIYKFKEVCLENNIKRIIVTASAKNHDAIKFYMKNGFDEHNVTLKVDLKEN